jgi:transcription elongation GreA/GreB family factor
MTETIEKLQARQRERRRRLEQLLERRSDRREDARQAKDALVDARERGASPERREELLDELLVARQALDHSRDHVQARQAAIARGARVLRRRRRRGRLEIVSRAEWGALAPRGSYVRNTAIDTVVIHHTAGRLPAPTPADEAAAVREVQRAHLGQGWTDVGYHYLVGPSGRVYECRPRWAVGAHVLNHNTATLGISFLGNFELASPSAAALAAAGELLERLGLDDVHRVGHYQLGPTACPGKNLKPHVAKLGG